MGVDGEFLETSSNMGGNQETWNPANTDGNQGMTNGKGKGDDNQQPRSNAIERAKEDGRQAARRMLDMMHARSMMDDKAVTKIMKKPASKRSMGEAMTDTKIIKKPAAKLTKAKKSVGKGKVKVAFFTKFCIFSCGLFLHDPQSPGGGTTNNTTTEDASLLNKVAQVKAASSKGK